MQVNTLSKKEGDYMTREDTACFSAKSADSLADSKDIANHGRSSDDSLFALSRQEFLQHFQGLIKASIRKYCYFPEDFDDLFQDGCIVALNCLDTYKKERGISLDAYVASYLRFYFLKTRKYLENRPSISLDEKRDEGDLHEILDSGIDLEGDFFRNFDDNFLNFVLKKLTKRQRQIIFFFYYKQMSIKAIGDALAISPNTVRNLKSSAIKALRNYFEKEDLI